MSFFALCCMLMWCLQVCWRTNSRASPSPSISLTNMTPKTAADALLLRHPHGMTSRACGYLTYQLALAIVAVHERALVHK